MYRSGEWSTTTAAAARCRVRLQRCAVPRLTLVTVEFSVHTFAPCAMYAQPVPTLHGLHIAVWPLLLLSVRPLYHANKWPGLKKGRTQIWSELETDGDTHIEPANGRVGWIKEAQTGQSWKQRAAASSFFSSSSCCWTKEGAVINGQSFTCKKDLESWKPNLHRISEVKISQIPSHFYWMQVN